MKTLELIKNRKEDNNGFANILANKACVNDYYSEEYNEAIAGGGFDFDLMYDCDEDKFFAVELGWGRTYEQQNNCIFIYQCTNTECEEELEKAVDIYLESQNNV